MIHHFKSLIASEFRILKVLPVYHTLIFAFFTIFMLGIISYLYELLIIVSKYWVY